MKKDIAMVFMVAGISSRFGGKIKQFAHIGLNNETLIEYSINQAINAGFTKIIFIVGNKTEKHFKEMFGSYYKDLPVFYALQEYDSNLRDRPWGTCDAVCSIRNIIDCPFVVCNGDDIYGEQTFKQLVEHLNKSDDEATIGYKLIDALPDETGGNRGIFKIKDGNVINIVETFNILKSNFEATNTKPDDLCSMNIFALHPRTIDFLYNSLETFKKEHNLDRKAECLLPDELSKLIQTEKIQMKIYPAIEKCIGVTYPEDEEKVKKLLQNEIKAPVVQSG